MTDSTSLLKAVIAKPDDDLPRLLFADWLDENGQGERAEFIRVQCELAGMAPCGADWTKTQLPCQWCDRKKREQELLERHWREWSGPAEVYMLHGLGYLRSFRRGFVEELACTWKHFVWHADAIRAATPLRRVWLTTWPATENGWRNGTARLAGRETFRTTRGLIEERPLVEMLLRDEFPGIAFELPPQPNSRRDDGGRGRRSSRAGGLTTSTPGPPHG